jgi:alkanesulfonate monooxygenase SsuD/methylene tetrahydromethanopterin reductase-like flavin-dependent oxidoreductase (luciferase family)
MSFPGNRQEVEADAALAMEAGLDSIATGDHLRHPRDPSVPLLDGWAVVSAWAMCTTGLRIGLLVSNLIYRHPVLVAKAALAADQLSDGRLDLGVGAGVYPTDHEMAGVARWSPAERVDRLSEFLDALDAALAGRPSFDGRAYPFGGAAWSPGPLQRPRPPLWVGAAGPRMLRLVAQHADGWSAFGGYAPTDHASFFSLVADQGRTLDHACNQIGRDPASLARSLLAFRPLAPWRSADALTEVVSLAHNLGFEEVILYKPADADEWRTFERAQDRLRELKTM